MPHWKGQEGHEGEWGSSGLVRAGWGRCPSRGKGGLRGPKVHAGEGRGRVWRSGKGHGSREVCQRRGEQVGRGSEWKGEGEGKEGGRKSRGIDQGRGDPGKKVGKGKTSKRSEMVWACGRKGTSVV